MAKISMIQREKKRIKTTLKYRKKRETLKEKLQQAFVTGSDEAWTLQLALQRLPRNASPIRVQRRCQVCGRPHAVYKKFGLCRLCIRKFGMRSLIPGLKKSSW